MDEQHNDGMYNKKIHNLFGHMIKLRLRQLKRFWAPKLYKLNNANTLISLLRNAFHVTSTQDIKICLL